jgi:hypothetical protein
VYYDIDKGNFDSEFTTSPGGITLPSGKRLSASSYMTYDEKVKYTIYFV